MTHINVFSVFLFSALGQQVKVEPEVLSYPGQTVNLRCAFTDATGIQLTMVRYLFITHFLLLAFKIGLLLYDTHINSKLSLWPEIIIKCLCMKL